MIKFTHISGYYFYIMFKPKNKKYFEQTFSLINKHRNIIKKTDLEYNNRLSKKYRCNVYLKREDQQSGRSFKIRGAFNKIYKYRHEYDLITTASAGNHAQGVALCCKMLKKKCNIFLPTKTPKQKIDRIKSIGEQYINLKIVGDNLDESLKQSLEYTEKNNTLFVHPFNDSDIILGQSTICQEIYNEINPDYIVSCVGGGGLICGIGSYIKTFNKKCYVIGAEPENANSMYQSIKHNKIINIQNLDTFVDGASVKTVGDLTYKIGKEVIDNIFTIEKNKLCDTIVDIYQNEGIILEPAGGLSLCSLDNIRDDIVGKNVVCILSGGNNDILRYTEIVERSLLYKNLKHYFLINFNQHLGELKQFINYILLENIDITRFEYKKKTNKDTENVLIGLELNNINQLGKIIKNLNKHNYNYIKINEDDLLYNYNYLL